MFSMRFLFFFILAFFLFSSMLLAQEENNPALSPTQLRQDAQYLEDLIFDAHIALSVVCDTNDLRSDFADLKNHLTDSMQASEFYTLLAPIFYQIKDVHCALNLPLGSNDYYLQGNLYLPLDLSFQDTAMYVIEDYFEELPPGVRVLSINDFSSDTIMKVIKSVSPSDGENDHTRELLASLFFSNFFPLFFHVDSVNSIEYFDGNDTLKVEIEGLNRRQYVNNQWFLNRYDEESGLFRYGYSETLQTAYMRVASFMGGSIGEYDRFLRNAFAEIHSRNPDCLILDLRSNPGGYSNRGRLLTRYLMPEPYEYVKTIVSKSSDMVRNEMIRESAFQIEIMKFIYLAFSIKPLKTMWNMPGGYMDTTAQKMVQPVRPGLRYDDNLLVVMINGLSASTSGLVINTLSKRPNTIFIGQPAACTIDGTFGQPIGFQLPNSGIIGQMSVLRFNQTSGMPTMQVIMPDIEVKPDIELKLDGIDSQLQFVIDLVKSKKAAQ